MIYLIDDKNIRQESFGWNKERLGQYVDVIKPLYSDKEIKNERDFIKEKGKIILYHDSFYDNPLNVTHRRSDDLKQELIGYTEKRNSILVLFSGSIGARVIEGQIAYSPPLFVYKNLEFILTKYRECPEDLKLEDILFGENYVYEQILSMKIQIYDKLYRKEDTYEPFVIMEIMEELNNLIDKKIDYHHGDVNRLKEALKSIKISK